MHLVCLHALMFVAMYACMNVQLKGRSQEGIEDASICLESQRLIIMRYFQSIMVYFGVWAPIILGHYHRTMVYLGIVAYHLGFLVFPGAFLIPGKGGFDLDGDPRHGLARLPELPKCSSAEVLQGPQ